MPLLYTPEGQQVEVDEASAFDALQSGQLRANRDERYAIIGPEGKAFTIAGVELPKAMQAGYRFANQDEIAVAKYGEENVAAFGAGVARGLSFGLSDMVMTESGLVKPETLKDLEKANPVMSVGGEVAGTVGSLLIPGGLLAKGGLASGALKAVTAPTRAVASLGAQTAFKAEGALLRMLTGGAKAGRLTGAAAKAGAFAASGAVEGSIYGIGQGISEAALGDPKPTGEALFGILGAGATGGLIGGVAGGMLGSAGALTGAAVDTMTNRAVGRIKKFAGAGAAAAQVAEGVTHVKTFGKTAAVLRSLQQALEQGSKRVDEAVQKLVGGAQEKGRKFVAPVASEALLQFTHTRDPKTAAKRYAKQLANLTANPIALADSISASVVDIETCAPELAKSIAECHTRAVQFLQIKAPKPPPDAMLQPQVDNWGISDAEAGKFGRYVTAALDPLSVVEELASGSITSEGPETLAEVYPDLYELLKAQVLEAVAESKNPLSFGAKVALSIMLQAPVDRSLTRDYATRAQEIYAMAEREAKKGAPGGGGLSKTEQLGTFNMIAPQTQVVQRALIRG